MHHVHLAEILRYASVGVRMSAGMVAHIGTRFGGFGELLEASSTCCTVSRVGSILNYIAISCLCWWLSIFEVDLLEEPFRSR